VLLARRTQDHRIEVIAAVPRSPACTAARLAVQYLPGAAAAGDDSGTILLRNVSPAWCELQGPVTHSLTVTVAGDQLVGSLPLSAGYRDDPTACAPRTGAPVRTEPRGAR
jgi:hypothetical protein